MQPQQEEDDFPAEFDELLMTDVNTASEPGKPAAPAAPDPAEQTTPESATSGTEDSAATSDPAVPAENFTASDLAPESSTQAASNPAVTSENFTASDLADSASNLTQAAAEAGDSTTEILTLEEDASANANGPISAEDSAVTSDPAVPTENFTANDLAPATDPAMETAKISDADTDPAETLDLAEDGSITETEDGSTAETKDDSVTEAADDSTAEATDEAITDLADLPEEGTDSEPRDTSHDTLRQTKMDIRSHAGRQYAQMHAERAARRWQKEAETEPYAIVKDTCYYTALEDENTVRGNFSKKRYKDDVLPQAEPVSYEDSEWYQSFASAEDPWGDYVEPTKKKQGVSHKTWFVILWLIIFWPVGLILMWARKKFPLAVRIIITIIIAAGLAGEVFFLSQYGAELYNDMMNQNGSNITAQTPDQDSDTQEPSSSGDTESEQKALDRAKEYLSNLPLSHDGMVTQLEFDGYSNADATYAADNCGANWNEQAARMANQLLTTGSYTRATMIEELKSNGFTDDQAAYGADAAKLK